MVILFTIFKHEPLTYNGYEYPWWGEAIGIAMTCSSIMWIPIYAAYRYFKQQCGNNEPNSEETCDKLWFWPVKTFFIFLTGFSFTILLYSFLGGC